MEKNQMIVRKDKVDEIVKLWKNVLLLNNTDPTVAEMACAYTFLMAEKGYKEGMQRMCELCTGYEHSSEQSTKPTKDSDPS